MRLAGSGRLHPFFVALVAFLAFATATGHYGPALIWAGTVALAGVVLLGGVVPLILILRGRVGPTEAGRIEAWVVAARGPLARRERIRRALASCPSKTLEVLRVRPMLRRTLHAPDLLPLLTSPDQRIRRLALSWMEDLERP